MCVCLFCLQICAHMEQSTTLVDISGLDKILLLKALWKEAPIAPFYGECHVAIPKFSEVDAAKTLLCRNGYIDYLCGRPIKVNIKEDVCDALFYDRQSRKSFQSIVTKMRDSCDMDEGPVDSVSDEPLDTHGTLCPMDGNKTKTFWACGEPMIENDPDTVLCGNCPYTRKYHLQQ